ncbi:MAG TPA: class I SAM-dependent methyltransferase [Tepidisphaeraceae bacterium]|nr:class I SAM-dependent methyltransferase [Tepidisphaeraceae bacterium]
MTIPETQPTPAAAAVNAAVNVSADQVTCELCGGRAWETAIAGVRDYISDETFAIRRCASCGLGVTHPQVPDAAIERYYPQRYRTDRQKYSAGTRVKLRAAAATKSFAPDFRGRLLDLGCGTGAFALEMQRRGWNTAVTELNDAVLDDMRSRGMEAKRPDDAMRDGFAAPFDVITCWHVLEHIERPVLLARWARANLAAGGVFQVTVPNLASWQAKLFGRHWLHLDPPRHRYHFTPRTLARLLGECGFEIVRSTSFAIEYDLFGVIQSAINPLCSRPNVLFEKLTAGGQPTPHLPKRDVALSFALSPLVGPPAVGLSLASWATGQGGTLTVTCKARAG